MITTTLATLADIKAAAVMYGNSFFSANTMRFFSSRVSATVYPVTDGSAAYFVTSERMDDESARDYTVRLVTIDSTDANPFSIDTVGEFGEYATLKSAQDAAKRLANA